MIRRSPSQRWPEFRSCAASAPLTLMTVSTFEAVGGFANGIKGGVERVWLPQGIATHGCFCPAIKKDHLS